MRDNAEKTKSSFLRMTELSLLLPGRQAVALQRMAQRQGLTVGQLIRYLIRDYLAAQSSAQPEQLSQRKQELG